MGLISRVSSRTYRIIFLPDVYTLSMVKLALQVKAECENVKSFSSVGEEFRWFVKLRGSGGIETDDFVWISSENEVEIKGSRGTANHVQKLAGKEVSVNIVPSKSVYNFEADEKWQTICVFECRGCDITEFKFSDGWLVNCDDGSVLEDCDFSELEFYDVNGSGDSVSVTELEFKFVKTK